jgi:uncharacterized membrane protein
MGKIRFAARLARHYAAFRGSPVFIVVLGLWVGVWLLGHHYLGIDKDLGEINLLLSIEAGISSALLVMDMARGESHRKRAEERHTQLLKYIAHMMEALLQEDER